jgi:glycosyltransferase involved in cell wall biosynthesis
MWNSYGTLLRAKLDGLSPDAVVVLPHDFPNVATVLSMRTEGRLIAYAPLLHEEDPAWNVQTISDNVKRADVVLALTEWERRRLIDSYDSDPGSTVGVPPGVAAPDRQSVIALDRAEPYVVSVGRRVTTKNLPDIADAVTALRRDGIALEFIVMGPTGDTTVDAALEVSTEAVEIVGEVGEAAKWSIIKGALATVSMSDRESFGIAAVESWRMAVPVVSRRIPVTEELVQDGINGLLVGDVHELQSALRTLVSQPETAGRMGAAGHQAAARFSWHTSADALVGALLHADPS